MVPGLLRPLGSDDDGDVDGGVYGAAPLAWVLPPWAERKDHLHSAVLQRI